MREGDVLVGKYRLDALLGSGGMGEVYRAENTLIGRAVAIKVLRPEHAQNAEIVGRFLREARAANLVRHPHVVDVVDIGQDENGVPFIVQELLEGQELSKHMEELGGALRPESAIELLLPVIEAVGLAHSRGVVHRDLKPENVFLVKSGDKIIPKLLDFGISQIRSTGDEVRTAAGMTMGTPAYMSPELIKDAREADARSDVWALGVILFEILTGRLPYDAETQVALFIEIASGTPPHLVDVAPHLPYELSRVIDRCMRKSPAERYQSAGELARDLANVLSGDAIEPTQRVSVQPARLVQIEPASLRPANGVGDTLIDVRAKGQMEGLRLPPPPDLVSAPKPKAPSAKRPAPPVFDLQPAPPVPDLQLAPPVPELRAAPPAPAPRPQQPVPAKRPAPPAAPVDVDLGLGSGLSLMGSAPARRVARAEPMQRDKPEPFDAGPLVGLTAIAVTAIATAGLLRAFAHQPEGWPLVAWAGPLLDGSSPLIGGACAAASTALGLSTGWNAVRATPIRWSMVQTALGLVIAGAALGAPPLGLAQGASNALWGFAITAAGLGCRGMWRAWEEWQEGSKTTGLVLACIATSGFFLAVEIATAAAG